MLNAKSRLRKSVYGNGRLSACADIDKWVEIRVTCCVQCIILYTF